MGRLKALLSRDTSVLGIFDHDDGWFVIGIVCLSVLLGVHFYIGIMLLIFLMLGLFPARFFRRWDRLSCVFCYGVFFIFISVPMRFLRRWNRGTTLLLGFLIFFPVPMRFLRCRIGGVRGVGVCPSFFPLRHAFTGVGTPQNDQ